MDQLYNTLLFVIDNLGHNTGNISTGMIVVKGTKIAFFAYYSGSSLLYENDIPN